LEKKMNSTVAITCTKQLAFVIMAILAAGLLIGCAKDKSSAENLTIERAENLTREGLEYFNRGRYSAALENFQKLKEQYPFSKYSLLAELKAADCNFHMKQYVESRTLYEEFERNHPSNEAVPYVLFQIGMSHYKQFGSVDRNTKGAAEAIQAFSRLLRSYPNSPYTEEASVRIKASRDFLAAHELHVANFYIRTGKYNQAASRLEYLLATFPETSSAPEASELQERLSSGNPPRPPWHSWVFGWLNPFSK
jgi:outer membrane protein assembly factor BamD